MQADLSMDNPEPANDVAMLWEKYQTINATTTAEDIDMRGITAQTILSFRRNSRLDLAVGDWLLNLSYWFPHIPDGLILRNIWLLFQNDSRSFFPEITGNLLELLERGLPFTGEVLSLAVWQVETLLVTEDLIDHKEYLQQLENQLRTTIRFYRPGELLAVFAGKPEKLSPQILGYYK